LLMDRYGLKADECVFIDDYPVNIEGARAAGMNGIVFKDPESAMQTLIDMGV
ncbi:MAG: HAD-IA family hydrolase, partial [Spirochaetales bacterium]|nr:HAD-IA family hydrolase [Spirochaetales bacterium]